MYCPMGLFVSPNLVSLRVARQKSHLARSWNAAAGALEQSQSNRPPSPGSGAFGERALKMAAPTRTLLVRSFQKISCRAQYSESSLCTVTVHSRLLTGVDAHCGQH
jgi:hypothetical protein